MNKYPNFDVIVVDQCPDESIADVMRPVAAEDRGLRYMRNSVPGKMRAQNLAIRSSDASIFVFTDDDCTVPTDFIVRIVNTFERLPNAGVLFGEVYMPDGHDWGVEFSPSLYLSHEHRLVPAFLPRVNYLFGCSMAVQRWVFARVGLFDEELGPGGTLAPANEEVDFNLRALRAEPPIHVYLSPAFFVEHTYGSRPHGDATRQLLRAYQTGKGAMLTKHMLNGDTGAACRLGLLILEPFIDGIRNFVTMGRPRGVGMIVPTVRGMRNAARLGRRPTPQLSSAPSLARRGNGASPRV
jgi:GT2 family glycosyltransferase